VKAPNGAPSGEAALVRRAALRLGLQTAAATLLVIAVMIAVVGLLLIRNATADEAAQLATTADRADDVTDPPDGMWIVMRTGRQLTATRGLPAGFPLTAALDRVAAGGGPQDTTVSIGGHDYRVRTQPRTGAPGTQVQVVLDEAPAQARRTALLAILTEAGLVGLAPTAVVGVWLGTRAVRPLQAALALQRRFVTDAGHELRTPLTLLSTRAQMLRRKLQRPDTDPSAVAREIDAVVADAGHLAAVLDDLLLVTDLRAPADTAVDLVELVTAVLDAARADAAEAGVSLDLDAPEQATVCGTEAALRRAVTAIIDNAVRHATTRVRVTIATTQPQVVVQIVDDGPGIDAAVLPRVFARFATTGAHPPDRTRHYGIGLALVGDVVARHGGTVTAANPPDGGAVFKITLPPDPTTGSQRS
jgi:two-component system, OmpR family, sensor kinase